MIKLVLTKFEIESVCFHDGKQRQKTKKKTTIILESFTFRKQSYEEIETVKWENKEKVCDNQL